MNVEVVKVQVCGEPVFGVWCPRCALPSAVALVVIIGSCPQIAGKCLDCGRDNTDAPGS